ncbi:aspartate/glutamate racemase family protein [Rhizobium halophytocola]|uniref:Asp/Glu/hydantoin racemase n=1 Tax=Rhizobium halophytocola TaxID=735519 RepID=A0ABS4DV95_9HYPH|nr:aspartate/glutamate racemase family protein [Rhizobium halophytocola]MBP1849611.1 Asp/Glu/hydantoin racemase [Rhizobium halophytocola]
MRIFWQSFIDETASAAYMARLSDYLNGIAEPGTTVEVHGISPPDRSFGRLSEFRCAILAIDNGLAAEEAGYDAVVMGHFQDPGLLELKSAVSIPVIGTGEATMHFAAQQGRHIGLVTLDDVFRTMHLEQGDLYGLSGRISHVAGLNADPSDFSACFAGDLEAKARMIEAFRLVAEPMVTGGADVIVPAGVLPGLLIGSEHGLCFGHAPVINCAAVALKAAEMQVKLCALNGLQPSRGPFCAKAPRQAIEDFRRLVANGRGASPVPRR